MRVAPGGRVGAGAAEHEGANVADGADPLCYLDEGVGQQQAQIRVLPTNQRLHRGAFLFRQGQHWLVEDDELAIARGCRELSLERQLG